MARILYCRCAYAQVVPEGTKDEVLRGLCESGRSFDCVADLCEMSARQDPALQALVSDGTLRIAACHPRAVKWLLHQGGVQWPTGEDSLQVCNMRDDSAETVLDELLQGEEQAT
jgi:hypothetical protein